MPDRSSYQPLAQSVDDVRNPHEGSSSARPGHRRASLSGHVDLSKLDTAFKRWTESIAQKVKRKKKVEDNSRKEILRSVFDPPIIITRVQQGPIKTLDHGPPMTQADFDAMAQSVRSAISEGIHPKMISKGSSGSYFARSKVEGKVQTVAVFKPKDEEPYGRLNPKTTKWLHRQFRWIIPFGRSCLIPNLSYVSEAAASLLDQRLELNIVPRTELVSLSSPAFFYDWLDRTAAKKGKPLPDKIGSLQCFMHGYQDASEFLRKHPWPGRSITDTYDDSTHRTGNFTKRFLNALQVVCGKTGDEEDLYEEEDDEGQLLFDATEDDGSNRPFYWSTTLQQSFREELEKLIILDYLMRNTDRGADNYMIKCCEGEVDKSFVATAPTRSGPLQMPIMNELRNSEGVEQLGMSYANSSERTITSSPNPNQQSYTRQPHVHIAAIDNSLAFPHEHPRGWRSFTYGWLYLPVSLIGRPFSDKTRNHFLPLLTSKAWWEETSYQLRKIFALDPDFNRKMFQRQLAVVKGQAYNIVQCLKHSDEGPLELTRRQKVLVWDDEVEVEDDAMTEIFNTAPLTASPKASIRTVPLPLTSHKRRSHSFGNSSSLGVGFPPPMQRRSTDDVTGALRPVPFSTKLPRVHPGTTGVTVLEHMERVDAVEAGLRRLGSGIDAIEEEGEEEEEVDVGMMAGPSSLPRESATATLLDHDHDPEQSPPKESDAGSSDLVMPASPTIEAEPEEPESMINSMTEEDLVALSKSTPQLQTSRSMSHQQWLSDGVGGAGGRGEPASAFPALDWMRPEDGEIGVKKRVMIVERLEVIKSKPLIPCW